MLTDRPPPSRSRRLGWRIGAGALALLVAGLWSAGWLVAARLAARAFETWMAAEADAGRQWTCPERAVDGYPFALIIHCTRPSFRGEVAGHMTAGLVEGLSARAGLDHPGSVVAALRSPLDLRAEDGAFELDVSWADLTVTIPATTGAPTGGALDGTRLAVTLAVPDSGNMNLRAGHLAGEARPQADQPGAKAFSFAASAVTFPTLDPIPGLDGPIAATGQGVLLRADLLRAPTVRSLEAWRQAQGALQLAGLSLKQASFAGEATGTLGLDDAHRAAGHLDTVLTGFAPIARRLGIPLPGAQLGGLLATLLGGGRQAPAAPGALQLPLTLADGHVAIGPFTTGLRLPPLY